MAGRLIWITGLSGTGKTTVAKEVYKHLQVEEPNTVHLDGDMLREILGNIHGHTREERLKLSYIYAKLCKTLTSQNVNVVMSTIALFHEIHDFNRQNNERYYEIFLEANSEELDKRRDLYKKGQNVVGVQVPPEFPKNPDLRLVNDTEEHLKENIQKILKVIGE